MTNQKQSEPMSVQAEALSRALKLLAASGVEYAVIDAAGTKHGTLEVVEKAAARKPRNHPPGAYLEYHKPQVCGMQAGQCKLVPFGPFDSAADRESLRSSLTAWLSRQWGNGTYMTVMNAAGIEVLRVE